MTKKERKEIDVWVERAEMFIRAWKKNPYPDGLLSSWDLRRAEGCITQASDLIEGNE